MSSNWGQTSWMSANWKKTSSEVRTGELTSSLSANWRHVADELGAAKLNVVELRADELAIWRTRSWGTGELASREMTNSISAN
ncbi:unnamed protein product [Cochlearia groenlandica]